MGLYLIKVCFKDCMKGRKKFFYVKFDIDNQINVAFFAPPFIELTSKHKGHEEIGIIQLTS